MATRLKNLLFVGLLISGVMGCAPAYVHRYGPDWYGPPAYSYSPSQYGTPSRSYSPRWYSYSYSPSWGYWEDYPRWQHRHYRWYWW
jgi:hypothetical protein